MNDDAEMYLPKSKLLTAFEAAACALACAHEIIKAHIQGSPMDFNRLENYFSEMDGLQECFDEQGTLIGAFLGDLAERGVTTTKPAGLANASVKT